MQNVYDINIDEKRERITHKNLTSGIRLLVPRVYDLRSNN